MVFSSLVFLYLFLPLCLLCYFLTPSIRAKNVVLLVFSLLFYAWGEPVYIFLMLAMAGANYGAALLLEKRHARAILALALGADLLCLAIFKYSAFLVENFNALTGLSVPVPGLALPIGISFYTFQALSYVVDVWRGQVRAQRSFFRYLLYLSMFPQLIAGPIVRYADVEAQLDAREEKPAEMFYGATRFCMGLAKKVLLADPAGKVAAQLLSASPASGTTLGMWLGVALYMFEIYFDFSGYSDMAIGMGRIFGFRFPENFRLPYTAKSITEFWRRWHISLSSFFRDYVYIPLGGNRRHVYRNLAVVWLLTGLWHGASWNYVLWGAYFLVLLVLERLLKKQLARIPKPVRLAATLFLVALSWDIFYYTDLTRLLESFRVLFGFAGTGFTDAQTGMTLLNQLPLLLVCAIGASPLPQALGNGFGALCAEKNADGARRKVYAFTVFAFDLLLLALATVSLAGSTFNAFIYWHF